MSSYHPENDPSNPVTDEVRAAAASEVAEAKDAAPTANPDSLEGK
jgi:hypothetical protein